MKTNQINKKDIDANNPFCKKINEAFYNKIQEDIRNIQLNPKGALVDNYFLSLTHLELKELMKIDKTTIMAFLKRLISQYMYHNPEELGKNFNEINCLNPKSWYPLAPYYYGVIQIRIKENKRKIKLYFIVKGILVKYKDYTIADGQEHQMLKIAYHILKDAADIVD